MAPVPVPCRRGLMIRTRSVDTFYGAAEGAARGGRLPSATPPGSVGCDRAQSRRCRAYPGGVAAEARRRSCDKSPDNGFDHSGDDNETAFAERIVPPRVAG